MTLALHYRVPSPMFPALNIGRAIFVAGRNFGLCLVESRPQVLGIFGLRFLAGAALASDSAGVLLSTRTLLRALVWVSAVTCVYLLNGVTDVVGDRVNGSRRPIARGDLDLDVARAMTAGFAAAAVLGAAALDRGMLLPVLAMLAVGWAYSCGPQLKRWTSGAAGSVLVAGVLSYLAGGVAVRGAAGGPGVPGAHGAHGLAVPAFAAAMSLWMGLVGATTKDLTDLRGDAASGRRTAAVVRGERHQRRVAAAGALFVAGAFSAAAMRLPLIRPAALVVLIGAIVVARLALRPGYDYGQTPAAHDQQRRPYRAFMVTQYLAHAGVLVAITVLGGLPV